MVRSAVVASSPLAILRSNHARSTSARDVEGDSAEGRGALRYRGCAHSQLRDFPSNRLSVRTARSPESRGSSRSLRTGAGQAWCDNVRQNRGLQIKVSMQ